jgi:hypothetical protein
MKKAGRKKARQYPRNLLDNLHRLKKVQEQIEEAKSLYQERDHLMKKIIPFFTEVDKKTITARRHLEVEGETFELVPNFLADDDTVKSTVWKSTSLPPFTIV